VKVRACAGVFPGAAAEAARAQDAAAQDVVVVRAIADIARAREATARPIRLALASPVLGREPGIVGAEIAAAVRAGAVEVALEAREVLEAPEKVEVLGRVLDAVRPAAGEARIVLDVAGAGAAAIWGRLQALHVDVLHVDIVADPRLCETIPASGSRLTLSLGLVTGADRGEEDLEALRTLVLRLSQDIATGECYLASTRGLAGESLERALACARALAQLRDAIVEGRP
jgi:hypothetical protein